MKAPFFIIVAFFSFVIVTLVIAYDHRQHSNVLCETFTHKPQPGLFDPFYGRVCSDNIAVKRIAQNFGECVKSGATVDICSNEQLSYFASSGADAEDAQKALALVLKAYKGGFESRSCQPGA